jgi:hypothetical protein
MRPVSRPGPPFRGQMPLDPIESPAEGDGAVERDVDDLETRDGDHAARVRGDARKEAVVTEGVVGQGYPSGSD